jgi:hypothetical protein
MSHYHEYKANLVRKNFVLQFIRSTKRTLYEKTLFCNLSGVQGEPCTKKLCSAIYQEYKANLVRKNFVLQFIYQEYKANLVRKNFVLQFIYQEYKANLVRKTA